MKQLVTTLLILVAFGSTGCIKTLLDKKKDEPADLAAKYAGQWISTKGAQDLNANGSVDANEIMNITGSSDLLLQNNGSFNYAISNNGNTFTMGGTWKMSTDGKSLTITDPAQGSIRFDIISATEIRTEPIVSGGTTTWLIYNK
jgi:hypothetical protein